MELTADQRKRGERIIPGLTIESLTRLNLSANGNPAYLVKFTDGSERRTSSDAGISYGIGNPEYRGVPLDVLVTRAGRIAYLARSV